MLLPRKQTEKPLIFSMVGWKMYFLLNKHSPLLRRHCSFSGLQWFNASQSAITGTTDVGSVPPADEPQVTQVWLFFFGWQVGTELELSQSIV